jgi:chromatin-remodeling ATPase INO80
VVIQFRKRGDHTPTIALQQVQDIVVGNKNFTDVTKPSEIVQLLLNDDQLANLDNSAATGLSSKRAGKRPAEAADGEPVRDLWNEEGDDFFVHMSGGPNPIVMENIGDDDGTPAPGGPRGKKRKAPGEGSRGRRSRPKAAGGTRRNLKSRAGNATPDGT